ncbi:hypothetical protein SRHO_G00000280 [Serrasalmus rhombeus]
MVLMEETDPQMTKDVRTCGGSSSRVPAWWSSECLGVPQGAKQTQESVLRERFTREWAWRGRGVRLTQIKACGEGHVSVSSLLVRKMQLDTREKLSEKAMHPNLLTFQTSPALSFGDFHQSGTLGPCVRLSSADTNQRCSRSTESLVAFVFLTSVPFLHPE